MTNTTEYELDGIKYIIRTIRVNTINSWKHEDNKNEKGNINTINLWSHEDKNEKGNINSIKSWSHEDNKMKKEI
jgi:hypothetical protein